MKTSLLRKTIDNCYGDITIECQSQNTIDDAILISCMNDSMVIEYSTIPEIIKHLHKLMQELDL